MQIHRNSESKVLNLLDFHGNKRHLRGSRWWRPSVDARVKRQLIMHELLIKVLNTPALRLVYWWKPGLNCQIQINRVPLTAEQLFSVNNIVASVYVFYGPK